MALSFSKSALSLSLVLLSSSALAQQQPVFPGANVAPPPGPYTLTRDPLGENNSGASIKRPVSIQPKMVLPSTKADFPPMDFDPEKPSGLSGVANPQQPSSSSKPVGKPQYAPLGTAVAPDQTNTEKELTKPENAVPTPKQNTGAPSYPPADTAIVPQEVPVSDDKNALPAKDQKTPEATKPATTYAPDGTAKVQDVDDKDIKLKKDQAKNPDEGQIAADEKTTLPSRYAPDNAAKLPPEDDLPEKVLPSKDNKAAPADMAKQPLPKYAPDDTAKIPVNGTTTKSPPAATTKPASVSVDAKPKSGVDASRAGVPAPPNANRYVPVAPAPGAPEAAPYPYRPNYGWQPRQNYYPYGQAYQYPPQAGWGQPQGYWRQPYWQGQPWQQQQMPRPGYQYQVPRNYYPYYPYHPGPNYTQPYPPQAAPQMAPQRQNQPTGQKG